MTQTVNYMAATSISPYFKVLDNYTLHLKAVCVDVITEVGDGIDVGNVQHKPWKFIEIATHLGLIYKPTGEPVISAFRKTLVAGEIIKKDYRTPETEIDESHFAEWFAAMADTLVLTRPAIQYILHSQDDLVLTPEELEVNTDERLWLRATATYSIPENLARAKHRINTIRKFLAMYDGPEYGIREKLEERLNVHLSATGLKAAGAKVGVKINSEAWAPSPYLAMFDNFYLHRHFFITEQGYMGTGPWTVAKGDVVMLVAGAPVPYIFRSNGDGTWKLVGEAYCHGMMGGIDSKNQAVPGLDLSKLNFETITVV